MLVSVLLVFLYLISQRIYCLRLQTSPKCSDHTDFHYFELSLNVRKIENGSKVQNVDSLPEKDAGVNCTHCIWF